MINSIEDIIQLHESCGNIEDSIIEIHFDELILKLNVFTLKFSTVNGERVETKRWNKRLEFEIRKDRKLYKEIREYRVLMNVLNRLKVRNGYLEKRECPDFVLKHNDKKVGIEITRIYSGNDWAAEKLNDEIKTYGIDQQEIPGYIEYRKLNNKIKTYQLKDNLIIKPFNKKDENILLNIKIKNKIFEKIRKLFEDYSKYDENVILADIVSPEYFGDINDIINFNEEVTFYINHLEENFDEKEYILLLKIGENIGKFDLKKHTCEIL